MKPEQVQRFREFLESYGRMHHIEETYGAADRPILREAAESLFRQSVAFLETLPYERIRRVLDVGLGYGLHAEYFARRGLEVTGISVHVSAELAAAAERAGYRVLPMDMHFLEFPEGAFDLVWASHSLEHSFSPLFALREWLRVLRPGGWLAATVPPYKSTVVSGHFCTGWTVGQLMYLLGVSGYELHGGRFLRDGYNVRGLARRPMAPLPDVGVSWLHRLADRLPRSVRETVCEHPRSRGKIQFEGDLKLVTDDRAVPMHGD